MNNIIKIIVTMIVIIDSNNIYAEIENIPQNNSSESQKKYSWEAFEEERKKINSIIDMTDLKKAYDEASEELKQIKHEANTNQETKENILRLKIRKKFLKKSIFYTTRNPKDYYHNISAMMHGLDNSANNYNCYCFQKEYNYEQCSRIRDQEYYAIKTMILASSQKNNISVEPMSKSAAQERYNAAKMEIDNLHKKEDDEYLASLSPEEAEKAKKGVFILDDHVCRLGNYFNNTTAFYDPEFMVEYSKESPYENDILATVHGLNQALSKKYQNHKFSDEEYNAWNLHDRHSIIWLKTNTIINMHHISNLRLIKEREIAEIQYDKTKKEIDLAIENLMETKEGKQYQNALQEYIIQKNNLANELTNTKRLNKSIRETLFALIAKALPREPLALTNIDYDVQNKFNSARENYYQATEMLIATEQYRNNFAPTEEAYYYWKYKTIGLHSIIKKNSCAIRTKYLPSPGHTVRTRHYFEPPIKTIKRMKNALIKEMYPHKQRYYSTRKTPDEYTCPPLCYKIREHVVTELLSIIEEMRIDAGLEGKKEEDTFYRLSVDKKSAFEHHKNFHKS